MPDRRSEAEESKGARERPKRRVLRSEPEAAQIRTPLFRGRRRASFKARTAGKTFKPAPGVSCAGLPWDEERSLTGPLWGGRPPGGGDYNLGRAGEGPNLFIFLSIRIE